ncbi:hypothetical protein [Hyalangium sp.]|uniref:hypothetical protein n=1 Tax=Hyalangium sp. TaxID=2028555 RepID=UPI002D570AF1|nr:hypothetical protein [Hyalangium sp.]HYH98681.1 hypothetical protein [Hyalangium sp.]
MLYVGAQVADVLQYAHAATGEQGQFGKEQAAAELKELKKDAGAVMVDLGLKRSDDTATA